MSVIFFIKKDYFLKHVADYKKQILIWEVNLTLDKNNIINDLNINFKSEAQNSPLPSDWKWEWKKYNFGNLCI